MVKKKCEETSSKLRSGVSTLNWGKWKLEGAPGLWVSLSRDWGPIAGDNAPTEASRRSWKRKVINHIFNKSPAPPRKVRKSCGQLLAEGVCRVGAFKRKKASQRSKVKGQRLKGIVGKKKFCSGSSAWLKNAPPIPNWAGALAANIELLLAPFRWQQA